MTACIRLFTGEFVEAVLLLVAADFHAVHEVDLLVHLDDGGQFRAEGGAEGQHDVVGTLRGGDHGVLGLYRQHDLDQLLGLRHLEVDVGVLVHAEDLRRVLVGQVLA